MKIAIGSDHGGFELKEKIKIFLDEKNILYIDLGTYNKESVDYPIYAKKVADEVLNKKVDFGIAICGTGIGICIASNKVKGIRCALCTSPFMARMAKKHNNANIIALGGRTTDINTAKEIIKTFTENSYESGRHQKRLDEITEIEVSNNCKTNF